MRILNFLHAPIIWTLRYYSSINYYIAYPWYDYFQISIQLPMTMWSQKKISIAWLEI